MPGTIYYYIDRMEGLKLRTFKRNSCKAKQVRATWSFVCLRNSRTKREPQQIGRDSRATPRDFPLTLGLGAHQTPPLARVVPHHPEQHAHEQQHRDLLRSACVCAFVRVCRPGRRVSGETIHFNTVGVFL